MRFVVAAALVATGVLAAGMLSGCGGSAPAEPPGPTVPTGQPTDPADTLSGLVAVGADKGYAAQYSYGVYGEPTRTVSVTLAGDGSWRVDVPGAGLGGARDVAVAGTHDGVYQCALGTGASCRRVAGAGGAVPRRYDPQVERLFVDWLPRLADRNAALSVAITRRLPGATGRCFSVEPTAASLSSPVPSGIYCLAGDGTVTGARTYLGTLVRDGGPQPAPRSVRLPGPVTAGHPVPTASPPPSPSPSPSESAARSHR